jgi:hypothetical protein
MKNLCSFRPSRKTSPVFCEQPGLKLASNLHEGISFHRISVRFIYIEANAINYAVRQQNVIDCSSSYLQKVDLRIEIFVPKLVYTENFMFGHSRTRVFAF